MQLINAVLRLLGKATRLASRSLLFRIQRLKNYENIQILADYSCDRSRLMKNSTTSIVVSVN